MTTYYDEIASSYDELHFAEQKRKAELVLKELCLKKTDTLLDVGCGTGSVTKLFECNIAGIDPSAKLLKHADFPVTRGSAENLPFPDKSFDVVISLTAIHNFTDFEKGITEMKRVARREVVISVLKKSKKFSYIESAIITLLHVKKKIEDMQDTIYFCEP